MRCGVAWLVLAACGDNAAPTDLHSGSRLALRWVDYDGARVLLRNYYDRDRNESCTPTKWGDHYEYCTPESLGAIAYRDAACMEPIGRITDTRPPPDYYATTTLIDGETLLTRLFPIGPPINGEPYYLFENNHCFLVNDTGAILRSLGPEIDRSSLVIMGREEVGEGRLATVFERGSDGMRRPIGFHDRVNDFECSIPSTSNVDVASCMPPDTGVGATLYADAACTELAWRSYDTSAPRPAYVNITDANGCRTAHRVGAPGPVYNITEGGCVDVGTGYALGPALDIATLTRTRVDATSRLQTYRLDPGGVADPLLFDRSLDSDCTTFVDGEQGTCSPIAKFAETFYRSSSCSAADLIQAVATSTATCAQRVVYGTTGDGKAHRLGDPITTPLFVMRPNCVPYTGTVRAILGTIDVAFVTGTIVAD